MAVATTRTSYRRSTGVCSVRPCAEAVGIERPPPWTSFGTNVTTLDALGAVPTLNFFTPRAKRRALVVFTDGESQP